MVEVQLYFECAGRLLSLRLTTIGSDPAAETPTERGRATIWGIGRDASDYVLHRRQDMAAAVERNTIRGAKMAQRYAESEPKCF